MTLLHEEEDFIGAIELFNQAEKMGFDHPELFYNRGWACSEEFIYHGGCDLTLAINDYSTAIERDPMQTYYYADRAWTYTRLERWDQAIADFSAAIDLEPQNPEYWVYRAEILMEVGDFDRALEDISQAIKIQPEEPQYYQIRAEISKRSGGHPDDIEKDLLKAVEINPESWEAHIPLAEFYTYFLDDHETALRHFNLAVSKSPKDVIEPLMSRGMFFVEIEDWDAAIRDFSLVIKIQPDNPDGYLHRGYVFREMGMIDEARQDFIRFLELTMGDPDYEGDREDIERWLLENQ
jgi:tetratricopeptide (TPR) repeat protein